MIDFESVTGWEIPDGIAVKVEDEAGNVLWVMPSAGGPVVLEVEKITSDTYAGETTYTGEQFILLNIYPKTNGTVSITYGGLTKTIVDTSGAEEPNAQQVWFGTFNGVTDEVETPTSGRLTIEGDYNGFGSAYFSTDKLGRSKSDCIVRIVSFGEITIIPDNAFTGGNNTGLQKLVITSLSIPDGVVYIGDSAFALCQTLQEVTIPASVISIGNYNPWRGCSETNILSIDDGNAAFKIDGNCLIEISTNILVSGFADSTIPSYVTKIQAHSFANLETLESITIPASVDNIDNYVFTDCTNLKTIYMLSTRPPDFCGIDFNPPSLEKIIVPKGSIARYTSTDEDQNNMKEYIKYFVEASE